MEFTDYNFPRHIIDEVRRQNFVKPTAIQAQGWPIALSGRNLVGVAKVSISYIYVIGYEFFIIFLIKRYDSIYNFSRIKFFRLVQGKL